MRSFYLRNRRSNEEYKGYYVLSCITTIRLLLRRTLVRFVRYAAVIFGNVSRQQK
jgi:hypothetical protein